MTLDCNYFMACQPWYFLIHITRAQARSFLPLSVCLVVSGCIAGFWLLLIDSGSVCLVAWLALLFFVALGATTSWKIQQYVAKRTSPRLISWRTFGMSVGTFQAYFKWADPSFFTFCTNCLLWRVKRDPRQNLHPETAHLHWRGSPELLPSKACALHALHATRCRQRKETKNEGRKSSCSAFSATFPSWSSTHEGRKQTCLDNHKTYPLVRKRSQLPPRIKTSRFDKHGMSSAETTQTIKPRHGYQV